MTERFRGKERTINDYSDRVLVVCPKCGTQSELLVLIEDGNETGKKKLVCLSCGYVSIHEGLESYRLWLEIDCKGHNLWALNERHLEHIEKYVRAKIREDCRDESAIYKNKTLISRLPVWIKSAKNREEILKCIKRLWERLE
jgi:hypothetical protein